MSRLPAHFHEGYLDDRHAERRFGTTPAELATQLDRAAPSDSPYELSGLVVQLTNPGALVGEVGPVAASVVPAALDEIARRLPGVEQASFFDPFAMLVIGVGRDALAPALGRFRRLIALALADWFDAVAVETQGAAEPRADAVAEDVVTACSPTLRIFAVRFVFGSADTPRGQRLLDYVFDARDRMAPEPWPAVIALD